MSDLTNQLNVELAGHYALRRELGRGGMATVYLAEDLRHRRSVAIKVLSPELSSVIGRERFFREIEIAAGLNHPHILPLHESGSAGDLLYYVMPYAEGESLRQRLEREKQLPLADALRIAREVADALDYANRRGVIHRDIKPENILLEEQHAVVADFGIARALVAAGGDKLTTSGLVIGTPAYTSPEQAAGSTNLDGRSDLYSLGCVLYEMLAGQPPFTGPTAQSLAYQHLSVAARPVTDLRPAVPKEVESAIQRTLAKVPADRFKTASEFAAALATSLDPAVAGPRPERNKQRMRGAGQRADGWAARLARRRAIAFALAVVAAAIGLVAVAAWQKWGPFDRWLGGPGATHSAKKDWILVAEFDGPPDDSSLAVTTRDLVSAALDQSEKVATVPRDQIRFALQMAGKPTNARVDAELAKELAYRSAVRAVLEGKIGRLGQGFSVVLRVVDADSARLVLTESALAKNQDALIPTLGRLAEKLRARLGERRSAIQAARPIADVATPSFEAYRLFLQARRLVNLGSARESIPVLRDALALDPDFAAAWRLLGIAYGNLDQRDSSLVGLDEALRRPQRLTPVQRFGTEGDRARTDGDPRGALAAYDRALQYDPTDAIVLVNSGWLLNTMGRFEEALERTRRAQRATPFRAYQIGRLQEVTYLSALGRVEEAREVARSLEGRRSAWARANVELWADNWAAAEKIVDTLLVDPGLTDGQRAGLLLDLATAQAARGALKAAAVTIDRAAEVGRGATAPLVRQNETGRARLMLAIASGGAIPLLPPDAWPGDSSTATLITRGLRAAIAGDRAGAQRSWNAVRARSRRELAWQGAGPALLQARIEALEGRWDEAARILQPIASQPLEIGQVPYPAGMSVVRCFLADTFEKLGQPDSAAVTLERVTSDPAPAFQEAYLRGMALPFAHRRLVMLYARMGRIEDAKRHWQIFTTTVRTPDPELQPLIAEARSALTMAQAMSRATRH